MDISDTFNIWKSALKGFKMKSDKNVNFDIEMTGSIDKNLLSIHTENIIDDLCEIVKMGRSASYGAVNKIMIASYWCIGKRIVEEEQSGKHHAEYGTKLIDALADRLTLEFGSGFSSRYLRAFRQFYIVIPNYEIWKSRFPNLTWTHIFRTLRVDNEVAIRWYLETASRQMWSVRTLDRNISTQYFERHFRSPLLPSDNCQEPSPNQMLKSPLIAEFLGFKQDERFSESELEASIIAHLKDFMMELGRGFAFMKEQQLVRTESADYYIDLVFYNVVLKCYVLIDLKIGQITHQDVGQMDMYVRMYDELKRTEGDNPTIGIVLCSETDADIARYSILKGNKQIFATKYKTYLPSESELREEIEKQKMLFKLQHENKEKLLP